MIDRIFSLVVALVLAALIWLSASSREQEMLDNVPVPVQISLPANRAEQYSLEVAGPSQVPVSFTGPPSRIRELRGLLQRGELSVDITLAVPDDRLDEARYHDTVRVEPSDVHAPPGVTAILVEGRNRIPVTLRRLVERRLPVRFDPSPEDRDRVGQVVVEPGTVVVRGPQEALEHLRAVATQPIALPQRPETAVAETILVGPVSLVDQIDGRPVQAVPESVMVRVTLQPRRKAYELDVPIHFLCPAGFPRKPRFRNERDGKVSLRVLGPASEEPPRVFAFIDLTAAGKFTAANASLYYDEPLQVQLPPGFQLTQPLPRFVAFELAPPEAPAAGPGATPPP
jgi:hypothetical protein